MEKLQKLRILVRANWKLSNINNAIAVLGAIVMVIRPIAAVGNPNPAAPFIIPAIIKIENKHMIKNICSVIISLL